MVLKNHSGRSLGHANLRGFFLHPIRGGQDTGGNRPMKEEEAGTEIMTRLPEQSLKAIKGCHRSKQK